jgi:hypothetical protein
MTHLLISRRDGALAATDDPSDQVGLRWLLRPRPRRRLSVELPDRPEAEEPDFEDERMLNDSTRHWLGRGGVTPRLPAPRHQGVPPAHLGDRPAPAALSPARLGREFDRIADRAKDDQKELQAIDDWQRIDASSETGAR